MPVYRHETYDYGPTFTLADLIAEPARVRAAALAGQGRIGAEAERTRGELGARAARDIGMIGAQKWSTLGQLAGNTLQNIGQYYADKPRRQAEALNLEADRMALKEAKRRTGVQEAVRMILSAPGLMVQDPQSGVSMYDKGKLSQELTAARLDPGAIAEALKTAEALDSHARDFVSARREAVAALAFEVLQAGSTPISVAGAVATGIRNSAFTQRDVQPFLKQIDEQGPDAIFPIMRRLTIGSAYEEQASQILSPADARSRRTREQLDLMKAESELRPKEPGTRAVQTMESGKRVTKIVPDVVGGVYETQPPAAAAAPLHGGGGQPLPVSSIPIIPERPDPKVGNVRDPRTGMTPNNIYQTGLMVAVEGQSAAPLYRMGSTPQAIAAKQDITNMAAAIADATGINLPELHALYARHKGVLTKMGPQLATLQAYANTAIKNLDLAMGQSAQVSRSGSPLTNRYMQWVQHEAGGAGLPGLSAFETYIYAAAREYAKVTSGAFMSAAELTQSAAAKVDQLMNAAQAPNQFAAVAQAMKDDMESVGVAWVQQVNEAAHNIDQLSEAWKRERYAPAGRTPQASPGRQPGAGQMIRARDPQGNIHEAPAGTPLPPGWTVVR